MPGQLLPGDPAQLPTAGPGPRERARILDGDLVLERVEVRPRKPLDQLQLVRVRNPAVGEPEVLVETPRVHDERIALPFSHRSAVIQWVVIVAANLPDMSAAVEVNDAEVVVPAPD